MTPSQERRCAELSQALQLAVKYSVAQRREGGDDHRPFLLATLEGCESLVQSLLSELRGSEPLPF